MAWEYVQLPFDKLTLIKDELFRKTSHLTNTLFFLINVTVYTNTTLLHLIRGVFI